MTVANYEKLVGHLEAGAKLIEVRPLPGSFSNETTLLRYETAVGVEQVVVRRYAVFGSYDRGEKAERECKALALCQKHHIPVPTPLLLDKSGELLGSPGIVTSFVPGQQLIQPTDEVTWVAELGQTLAKIHAIPLTENDLRFMLDGNDEVVWFLRHEKTKEEMFTHPDGRITWQAVYDLLPTIQPTPPALMHIDYWLGNILWQEGRITAVLDWEEASYGNPGYDVAYLRLELAMLGGETLADAFLAAYVQAYGRPVANLAFWELAAAARFLPTPEGMIGEWQTLQPGAYDETAVQQNFRNVLSSALKRAGVTMEKKMNGEYPRI
ncbi:MAG: phosphotransferase family protein [Ardenticatenaceae bacterium]|nr:phosphotransferase family protein [Ardenticatenaceae bacterium]